jgi:hypothetical protein
MPGCQEVQDIPEGAIRNDARVKGRSKRSGDSAIAEMGEWEIEERSDEIPRSGKGRKGERYEGYRYAVVLLEPE